MSTTTLMFHAFGVRGYQLKKSEILGGEIVFHIEQDKHNLRCPQCKGVNIIRRGVHERKFKSIPIGLKRTFIMLPVQRIECFDCNLIPQVKVTFAKENKRYTRAFEKYALELLKYSTVQDVADHMGVGWDLIKEIDFGKLKRDFSNPPLKEVKKIAIDEISAGKRHNYLTIVLDLDKGNVLFLGKGKGGDALEPFWRRLKRSGALVEAASTDMSPAYTRAVADGLPKAVHVTDHFHVIKLMNEKLSELRIVIAIMKGVRKISFCS